MSVFSSFRDRAEALRDGIEELLLHESAADAVAHLRDAEVAVSRFCELGATDAGISALDALSSALTLAKASLRDSAPDTATLLDEAGIWTKELRLVALDDLARQPPGKLGDTHHHVFGFRASFRTPAVHQTPDMPALPVLAKEKAWDAPPDDDEVVEDQDAITTDPLYAGLVRLGRDTMEDIAILGGLRRLDDTERLGDGVAFEERLLANLDLLWSLDVPFHDDLPRLGVPKALFRYATEWSTPDWGRAFALSFGLGCTSSETALRWVMLAMRRTPKSSLGAFVHGLSNASSPHVDKTVLAELRTDASPELLAALLEIAERRGIYEASAVIPLLAHPVLEVKLSALRALRSAPPSVATTTALQFLDSTDGTASDAAEELARRNHPAGLTFLRNDLGASDLSRRTLALRALVLSGSVKDEALVLEHARTRDDGPRWLGFFGWSSVIPTLLEILAKERDGGFDSAPAALRVERALQRVTGLDTASVELATLRAQIEQRGFLKKAQRLRLGEPHAPKTVVSELANLATFQGDRRILARELSSISPDGPRLSVDAFIGAQLAFLASVDTK